MDLSSINELLDRFAALGVATDYDQIGPKTDLREINSPQVTHHVAVVEGQCGDPSSILRTRYVRIPDPSKPDTRGGEDITQDLNLESGDGLDSLDNIQESKFSSSEIPWPLSLRWGEASDLIPPTHPNISDLSQIRQKPEETVHHYWERFLLVMNRIKDCREEDAISIFCNNCTDPQSQSSARKTQSQSSSTSCIGPQSNRGRLSPHQGTHGRRQRIEPHL